MGLNGNSIDPEMSYSETPRGTREGRAEGLRALRGRIARMAFATSNVKLLLWPQASFGAAAGSGAAAATSKRSTSARPSFTRTVSPEVKLILVLVPPSGLSDSTAAGLTLTEHSLSSMGNDTNFILIFSYF